MAKKNTSKQSPDNHLFSFSYDVNHTLLGEPGDVEASLLETPEVELVPVVGDEPEDNLDADERGEEERHLPSVG